MLICNVINTKELCVFLKTYKDRYAFIVKIRLIPHMDKKNRYLGIIPALNYF
jgi:hypothetical protein